MIPPNTENLQIDRFHSANFISVRFPPPSARECGLEQDVSDIGK